MRKIIGLLAFAALFPLQAQADDVFQQTRNNVALTCGTEAVGDAITPDDGNYSAMLVTNSGTAKVYIRTGDADTVATVQRGTPILPDSQQLLGLSRSHTHVSCITGGGTAAIEVSPGIGQ